MALILIIFAVFNVGFLIGSWWGSGWGRRERSSLRDEVSRLRMELEELTEPQRPDRVVYLDRASTKQIG